MERNICQGPRWIEKFNSNEKHWEMEIKTQLTDDDDDLLIIISNYIILKIVCFHLWNFKMHSLNYANSCVFDYAKSLMLCCFRQRYTLFVSNTRNGKWENNFYVDIYHLLAYFTRGAVTDCSKFDSNKRNFSGHLYMICINYPILKYDMRKGEICIYTN